MPVLKSHLSFLSKHADLLETIFRARRLEATDDTARDLEALRMKRVLVCGSDGMYRINSREKKFFEMIFDQRRAFDTGNPISHEIENLKLSSSAMHESGRVGNTDQADDHMEDAIDTILGMSVSISDQIRIFELSVRNEFHNARTMAERQSRNLHFQTRARELLGAIYTLNSEALIDVITTPYTAEIRRNYNEEVLDHIDAWSIRLSGLIKEMSDFLYRSKRIEEETRRFRVISHALDSVPVAEQVEVLESQENQTWPSKGVPRTSYDVLAMTHESAIEVVTAKLVIDPTADMKSRTIKAGVVAGHVDYPEELEDPFDDLIDEVIEIGQKSAEGVSVRKWASDQGLADPDEFVIEVFDSFLSLSSEASYDGLHVEKVPAPHKILTSGLTDLILSREGAV